MTPTGNMAHGGQKGRASQAFASVGLSILAVRGAEARLPVPPTRPAGHAGQQLKQNFKPAAQAQRNIQAV